MKRSSRQISTVFAALVTTLALGQASRAGTAFSGTESGSFITLLGSPVSNSSLSGTGTDTLDGAYTDFGSNQSEYTSSNTISLFNGVFERDYATGDKLFGTFSGMSMVNASMDGGTTTLYVTITGGTGIFLGVTGSETVQSTVSLVGGYTPPTLRYTYTSTYSGSIVPEPSSLLMMGIGLATVVGAVRWPGRLLGAPGSRRRTPTSRP